MLRNENALQFFLLKFTPQVIVGKYGTSSVSSKLMNRSQPHSRLDHAFTQTFDYRMLLYMSSGYINQQKIFDH